MEESRFDRVFEKFKYILRKKQQFYRAFHGFGQAKFVDDASILGSSQFSLLYQLPLKMTVDLKVVKISLKIILILW